MRALERAEPRRNLATAGWCSLQFVWLSLINILSVVI